MSEKNSARRSVDICLKAIVLLFVALLFACGSSATATPQAAAPTSAPTSAPSTGGSAAPTARPQATEAPPAKAVPSGTLSIGYKDTRGFEFHPSLVGANASFVLGTLGERTIILNQDAGYEPRIIREWSTSPDGTVWTFNVQKGVQFNQGYGEVTAEDIIWSYGWASKDGSRNAWGAHMARLWGIEEGRTKQLDDYTIEVNTGVPYFDMLNVMAFPQFSVYSKKLADELGEEAIDEFSAKGVGTGPWQLGEIKLQEKWTLEAVDPHWRKTPDFAELVYWHMPEESTRLANFQVGKLDTFDMSHDSIPVVEKIPGTKFMRSFGKAEKNLNFFGNLYVGWGTPEHKEMSPAYDPSKPYISSSPDPDSEEWKKAAKVRRAMSIAIDRQDIVDNLLRGEGRAEMLPHWEFHLDKLPSELTTIVYNPEEARQLLTEAGYPDGFDVTMITGQGNQEDVNEAIAAMWEQIGISTRLEAPPYASFRPQLLARSLPMIYTHAGVPPDPLNNWSAHFRRASGYSLGMDHPILEEGMKKAMSIVDEKERFALMVELAQFVHDSTLVIGIYSTNIVWPLGPRVDSWVEHIEFVSSIMADSTEWARHR